VALVIALGSAALAQTPSKILAKDAKWEQVSSIGKVWAEGVVAAKDGTIYLSDLTYSAVITKDNPRGTIYRYNPATGEIAKYLEPSGMSNGLHVDKNGDLLIAQDADFGGRAIVRRNLATGEMKVLADSYEGKRFNGPNDLTSDAQGRIYFTDARYGGNEPMEMPHAVYRIDPDGKVVRLASEIFRPNGIEIPPDGKRLYVNACNSRVGLPINPLGPAQDKYGFVNGGVVVYKLDAKGNISAGKVFFRAPDDMGADGTAMDTEGNLYLALHNGNPANAKADIVVISPKGKVIEHLPVPGKGLTTNLAFGRGADKHTLYVTTGAPWGLYKITTVKTGFYQE
jgi:gluconolactonase